MLQLELIEAAAQAGKHVFCEKPVGGTPAQTARAEQVARQAGVITGVGYNYRWAMEGASSVRASSAVRCRSSAATASRRCWALVAPTIGDETPGLRSTQASATWAMVTGTRWLAARCRRP